MNKRNSFPNLNSERIALTSSGHDGDRYDSRLVRKSCSLSNCIVEKKRGFRPSDRHDPLKKQFLIDLSKDIWHKNDNDSSNASRKIDLHKIFTPATDAEEITPKNRKHYASSAFYSPVHPTVEDQVELARRISHSLSDISNQTSKGQTMYVNRKKRSVKWVHESCGGKEQISTNEMVIHDETKENNNHEILFEADSTERSGVPEKVPLKLLMNPRGQMLDFTSVQESFNTETGLLSPENCAELINALKTQKGKGAELFAKRRRKADEWVVSATNAGTQSSSGIPDIYQQPSFKPPVSPSLLPAYSDAGKHRVQLNMQQEQVLEKYAKPSVKALKTPWEAALETGSASSAFVEENQLDGQYQDYNRGFNSYPSLTSTIPPKTMFGNQGTTVPRESYTPTVNSFQRELAYRPRLAQGWKAPSVSLPKDLYLPKEIPLESYAPPPTSKNLTHDSIWKPNTQISMEHYQPNVIQAAAVTPSYESVGYITENKRPNDYHGISAPIKQFQNVNYRAHDQQHNQTVSQVNFNPSPLSLEKVAKFENASDAVYNTKSGYGSNVNRFPTRKYQQMPAQQSHPTNTYTLDGNRGRSVGSGQSNAHNFNNSARGWKSNANNSFYPTYASTPIAVNAANLPYSDF